MSLRLRLYVALVILTAVVLLGFSIPHDLASRWPHYLAWVLVCVFSETLWLHTLSGEGTLSMASVANLATAILWGRESAIDLSFFRPRTLSTRPSGGCISRTSWSFAATASRLGASNARHMRRSVPN